MKYLYSFFLAMLLTVQANAFTLFIDVDDISRISEITTYPAQSGKVDLAADEIYVEFDDNNAMRYVTITAVTGKYITGYKFVDEDGRELSSKSNATGKLSYIAVPKEADYGRMIVTTADALKEDAAVKVTLVGDPKKLTLSLNAKRNYDLVKGEQTIEFFSATEGGTWYIMPVGVTTLYKVVLNDVEVKATQGWDGAYQYTMRVNNGDNLYIETDHPNVKHNVTLTVPEGLEGVVESVTVDGTAVDNWKQMQVKSGSRLVVTLNDGDYKLTEFTINGGENLVGALDENGMARFINSWATLVEGDIALTANGILVERPYRVKMQLFGMGDVEDTAGKPAGDTFMMLGGTPVGGYYFARSTNKPQKLVDGAELPFCDDDNPFFLELRSYSETEDVQMTVKINDDVVEGNNNQWSLTFRDGDILSVYFGIDPDADGVTPIAPASATGTVYNLNGCPVSHPKYGLYISKGKKTVVR